MPTTETVSFKGATTQLGGYVAFPEGEGPFPGVLIIHEIFGINDNIKDITRRFADAGYTALAVDLFADRNRAICMFRFMGQMQLNPLNNGSIQDLKQSLTYLAEQPQVDSNRIGTIGFCMGGSFAIAWACTDDRLKAIAPLYGMNPRPLEAVQRLCPVVGSYPAKTLPQRVDKHLTQHLLPITFHTTSKFTLRQNTRFLMIKDRTTMRQHPRMPGNAS